VRRVVGPIDLGRIAASCGIFGENAARLLAKKKYLVTPCRVRDIIVSLLL
jgi:hypothetical protein